jgi:hypothetical protein
MPITKDNSKQLLSAVDTIIEARLNESAQVVEDKAAELVHIKTGATKNSLQHEVSDKTATIGVTTSYAHILENRFPFLRPALHMSLSRIKDIFNRGPGSSAVSIRDSE